MHVKRSLYTSSLVQFRQILLVAADDSSITVHHFFSQIVPVWRELPKLFQILQPALNTKTQVSSSISFPFAISHTVEFAVSSLDISCPIRYIQLNQYRTIFCAALHNLSSYTRAYSGFFFFSEIILWTSCYWTYICGTTFSSKLRLCSFNYHIFSDRV